ncbi:hypothetical protein GKE82_26225 [Conexibacter sp. W3-3-2]|uniref:hypothetical protein n=1 Tax=Conexibacter sp. W3-3-2 TaxID=2675227 RepID=UPI0012B6EC08|nr:hypothetical protein [Conexibacter sp. W3-3-2]MTD47618.1 hypothetical protein [Conexibacter sp. W3-3-2]MTD47703.1 hypothetical protein [Conexibacter sp. W3-3-2]
MHPVAFVDPQTVSAEKAPTYKQLYVIAALLRGGEPPNRQEASKLINDLEAYRLLRLANDDDQ